MLCLNFFSESTFHEKNEILLVFLKASLSIPTFDHSLYYLPKQVSIGLFVILNGCIENTSLLPLMEKCYTTHKKTARRKAVRLKWANQFKHDGLPSRQAAMFQQ